MVLRRGGEAWINDDLPALQALVEAYRELQTRWDPGWTAEPSRPTALVAIHQCGMETAWNVRGGAVHGISLLERRHPLFGGLAPSVDVAYHGRRKLDALDEALLTVRAEAALPYNHRLEDAQRLDARLTGLLATGWNQDALATRTVEARFDFYGLGALHALLRRVLVRRSGPIWTMRQRYIDEFGVPEASLA
jgi:hypothetical protein